MKLCPNCNKVFETKANKLHCETHGWHEINAAGEIIPAAEPTAQEISDYEKAIQVNAEPAKEQPIKDIEPEPEKIEAEAIQSIVPCKIPYNESIGLLLLAIIGIAAIGILTFKLYKKKQQRAAL